MPTIPEKSSTVQLLIGIALAEAGAALAGCGQWDLLQNEGFIEKRWPCLSEKIQEETDWAFF
jgi:hypothetical protein